MFCYEQPLSAFVGFVDGESGISCDEYKEKISKRKLMNFTTTLVNINKDKFVNLHKGIWISFILNKLIESGHIDAVQLGVQMPYVFALRNLIYGDAHQYSKFVGALAINKIAIKDYHMYNIYMGTGHLAIRLKRKYVQEMKIISIDEVK